MIIRTIHNGFVVNTGIVQIEICILITTTQRNAMITIKTGATECPIQPIRVLQIISIFKQSSNITRSFFIVSNKIRIKFIFNITSVQKRVFILHQHKLTIVHYLHAVRQFLPSHITGIIHMENHFVFSIGAGVFSSNNDNTVSTLRTIDSGSSSVFQNVHRCNICRSNIRNRANRHTVHDIQRVVALGQRCSAADTNLYLRIRATFRCRHIHTG